MVCELTSPKTNGLLITGGKLGSNRESCKKCHFGGVSRFENVFFHIGDDDLRHDC